jgi:hypothetical protein
MLYVGLQILQKRIVFLIRLYLVLLNRVIVWLSKSVSNFASCIRDSVFYEGTYKLKIAEDQQLR